MDNKKKERNMKNPPTPPGSLACESLSGRNPRFLSLPLPPPGQARARKFGQSGGGGVPPPAILTLGGLGQIFVQQRLPPELPRATGPRQGAHKRTDIFRPFFFVARVSEKSALLGTGSVDSLPLWGAWAKSLFNKDCLQSFPGPPGRAKEPTRAPTFSQKFEKSRTGLRSQNLFFWI